MHVNIRRTKMTLRSQLALCAATCLLLAVSVSAQSSPQLLLQGRFGGDIDKDTGLGSLPVVFSWPASSVYVTFNSTSINATLSALPPTNTSAQYARFAFYLDQTEAAVETMTPEDTMVRWGMTGLRSGLHNLTITKLTEAAYGEATLETLTVGRGGRFLTPDLPTAFESGRRILFLGDSYTVGFGNVGGNSSCNLTVCQLKQSNGDCYPELDSENAAVSWGPITAANLQADYQVIAWSGAGLDTYRGFLPNGSRGYMTGMPDELPETIVPEVPILFGRQVAADNTSMVPNSTWVPQIVILAGGTNDFHAAPPVQEQWTSDNLNFMSELTEDFGDQMQIILQVFPQELQSQGELTPNQTSTYLQYMTSLYTAAQLEGMNNVHLLQLSGANLPIASWCVRHPSAAADANIAAQLTAYINRLLPNYATSMYPRAVQV